MRARSRPRRETSGADLRHAIKNSLLPRGVFVTRVTDITHIILLLHCRRRSWRQAILRDEEPNLRRRCLSATRVALWPQRNRTDHSQANSPMLSRSLPNRLSSDEMHPNRGHDTLHKPAQNFRFRGKAFSSNLAAGRSFLPTRPIRNPQIGEEKKPPMAGKKSADGSMSVARASGIRRS